MAPAAVHAHVEETQSTLDHRQLRDRLVVQYLHGLLLLCVGMFDYDIPLRGLNGAAEYNEDYGCNTNSLIGLMVDRWLETDRGTVLRFQ